MTDTVTFLPHLIRQIPGTVTLDSAQGRLVTTLELQVTSSGAEAGRTESIPATVVPVRGPADILGIDPRSIARTEPPAGSHDFETNYFVSAEAADSDFFWRYSLDVDGSGAQVRPWLSLIVLSLDELDRMRRNDHIDVITTSPKNVPLLSVRRDLLPSLTEAWALAHVHLAGSTDDVSSFLDENPAQHCARLFCARRLEPNTHYFAYLVPNYRIAVDAALGITGSTAGDQDAWADDDDADAVITLAVYYQFEFFTAEKGDFESLARRLVPAPVDAARVGLRAVDASLMDAEGEPDEVPSFKREGALAAPGYTETRLPYSEASEPLPYTTTLFEDLNESLASDRSDTDDEDPLVTLPVYGRYFRKTSELKQATADCWPEPNPWVHELNLDFRARVGAGLGARVVDKNADEYSRLCWSQVGQIRAANEKIRQTQAAFDIGSRLHERQLSRLSDARYVMALAPFHAQIATTDAGPGMSLEKRFAESGLLRGVLSSTMRRVAHRTIGISKVRPFEPWNKACQCFVRPRKPQRPTKLRFDPGSLGLEVLPTDLVFWAPKAEVLPVQPMDLERDFRARIDLKRSLRMRLENVVRLGGALRISDDFDPLLASPHIDRPMYQDLQAISLDYLLPGIEFLQANGVTLMEENRKFIESFMAGLTTINDRLVWQHFPSDRRGTVFRYFWSSTAHPNPLPDIRELAFWTNELGANVEGPTKANLVLVIKGDLIRRYPDTVVYAVRVSASGVKKYWSEVYTDDVPPSADVIAPVFRATVGRDIQFVGFPFALDNVSGDDKDGEYYIVLQEHQSRPRFGLDVQSVTTRYPERAASSGAVIADASWDEMEAAGAITAGYLTDFSTLGDNAATVARRTYQKPVRVAIHVSTMLDEGTS